MSVLAPLAATRTDIIATSGRFMVPSAAFLFRLDTDDACCHVTDHSLGSEQAACRNERLLKKTVMEKSR